MAVLDRLRAELRSAMKAKDTARVRTLRTMVSALDNASAVEVDTSYVPIEGMTPDVPRRELSEEDELSILRKEAESRQSALKLFEEVGKTAEVERLRAELELFTPYLGGSASS